MRILVTGGAGFIGSHLVEQLTEAGHDVVVLDNFLRGNKLPQDIISRITLVQGDVRDEKMVFQLTEGCQWVFHLAAYLGVDIVADHPVETMETEAVGTKNISNSCIVHGVEKLIYISTSGVYGKAAIENAVNEDYFASPSSSYSIAKRFNEIYLQSLFQEKKLRSCSLRYFNVYGPRQDSRMVIPRFFEQAMKNEPLTVYGNGKQTRDFTYIDDTIKATILAAEALSGCEIVNVARGKDVSISETAEKIVKIVNSKSEIVYLDPPSGRYDFEVQRRSGCSDKLKRMTSYRPSTPLDEGLLLTHEYYKRNLLLC